MRIPRSTALVMLLSLVLGCGDGSGGDDDGPAPVPPASATAIAVPTGTPLPSIAPTPTPSFEEVVLAVATRFGPISANDGGTFRQLVLRYDAGTWESVSLAPTVMPMLRGIVFASPRVAYAFGGQGEAPDGVMIRSDDAGHTWRNLSASLPPECPQVFDAVFADEETGYIVGRGTFTLPAVFRTIDGGASWQPIDIPPSLGFPLHGAYALGLRADAAELIRYDGGGLVDVRLDDPIGAPLVIEAPGGASFAGANAFSTAGPVGWIVEAYGGSILRSDLPGAAWNRQVSEPANTHSLLAIDVRGDRSGVAGGADGSTGAPRPVLFSTEDGIAWQPAAVVDTIEGGIRDVLRLRDDAALAMTVHVVGSEVQSRVLRSADGGQTWYHEPTRFERGWWIHDLARNTERE